MRKQGERNLHAVSGSGRAKLVAMVCLAAAAASTAAVKVRSEVTIALRHSRVRQHYRASPDPPIIYYVSFTHYPSRKKINTDSSGNTAEDELD